MTDYRKMWQDLNMDIEIHDQLCKVLPQAFGDVYLSQKNQPENMAYYNTVVLNIHGIRPAELVEAQKKKNTKIFGTFCVYVPDEIIFAANGIATGLCGGSQFWVPSGEKVLPTSTCPLIKASIGARIDRTCPFFSIADIFVGETTCDGKKKAYEILNNYTPVYVMDLPQQKRAKDVSAWAQEIHEFLAKVEEITGNKATTESLSKAIKLVNNKRRALQRLYNFRKLSNPPISGKDCLLVSQIAFYDDPTRFTEMTNKLCDELDQRVRNGVSVYTPGAKRILFTGTPMAIPNWKLHQVVESESVAVVGEETCTGIRYFDNLVDENQTTLDGMIYALAERYMKINCACFTPNTARVDDIKRYVKEYTADGVIDVNLKFCTLYDTEGYIVEKALKENGIPVLGLETDYNEGDFAQLRTRVEAFLEILNTT